MCTGRRHRRSCSSLSSCVSIVYLGAGAAGAAGAAAWVQGLQGLQPGCRGCRGCSLGAGAAGAAAWVPGLQPGCRGCSVGAGAAAWVPGLRRGCRGCGAPLGELLARHEVALAHDDVEAHVGLAVEEVEEVAIRSPERLARVEDEQHAQCRAPALHQVGAHRLLPGIEQLAPRMGEALTEHQASTGSANPQGVPSRVRMAASHVARHVDELRAVRALAIKVEVTRHAREVLDGRDPNGAA